MVHTADGRTRGRAPVDALMEFHRFHYLDASVLVQLVVPERGAKAIRLYLKEARSTTFYAIVPCFIETFSALKLKYQRDIIDEATYFSACDNFGYYTCDGGRIELENVDISDSEIFQQVERIVKRANPRHIDIIDGCQIFAMKRLLKTLSCSQTMEPILVTADKRLANAARQENLKVWFLTDTIEGLSIE